MKNIIGILFILLMFFVMIQAAFIIAILLIGATAAISVSKFFDNYTVHKKIPSSDKPDGINNEMAQFRANMTSLRD